MNYPKLSIDIPIWSEYAMAKKEMESEPILGPIPEVTDVDWISDFVQECAIKDVEEDLFGDQELMPYDPKQYFNFSVPEIAKEMGIPILSVRSILKRAKDKIRQRLLILCLMDIEPEEKICGLIRAGREAINNKLSNYL